MDNLLGWLPRRKKPEPDPFPSFEQRIRLIRRLKPAARLDALRAGLGVADAEEARILAVELAELAVEPVGGVFLAARRTQAGEALVALAGAWDALPQEHRALAIEIGRGRWSGALARGLSASPAPLAQPRTPDPRERHSAASLARALAATDQGADTAASLVAALALDDPACREHAGAGLLSLSLRAHAVTAEELAPETADFAPPTLAPMSPLDSATIDALLADAAWSFADHQQRAILVATLAALDLPTLAAARRDADGVTGPARLLRLVQDPTHAAGRGLRHVVRLSPAPLVRARALLLLAEPAMATAALDRVARAESPAEHEAVLLLSHLSLRPARSRPLGMVQVRASARVGPRREPPRESGPANAADRTVPTIRPQVDLAPGQAVPLARVSSSLTRDAQVGRVRLLRVLNADDIARTTALEPLLDSPDTSLRLSALPALPRTSLAHFCFDSDPAVARGAMLRWSTAGIGLLARADAGERTRQARLLRRSPHARLRALAERDLERETPWMARSEVSRVAAWRLALRDREAFLSRLRAIVTDAAASGTSLRDAAPTAIDAIGIARRLGLVRVIAPDLAELVEPSHGTDARLAATAAAALGDVDDAIGRAALRRALDHTDPRVRANAVEGIGLQRLAIEDATTGRDRDHGVLLELKGDPHHRVRANAIRALLRAAPPSPRIRRTPRRARPGSALVEPLARVYEASAVESLRSMLTDDRPLHRLAGSWLAGRVLAGGRERLGDSWNALSTLVTEMASSEPIREVRSRAANAAARISATVRAGWAGSTQGVAPDAPDDGTIALAPAEPAGMSG
ncbi:MAG: hypothetical protein KDA05_01430 [Phycisphaerales bacterium]|nr:hypothetical protein [Phycisphaerales bacterium]